MVEHTQDNTPRQTPHSARAITYYAGHTATESVGVGKEAGYAPNTRIIPLCPRNAQLQYCESALSVTTQEGRVIGKGVGFRFDHKRLQPQWIDLYHRLGIDVTGTAHHTIVWLRQHAQGINEGPDPWLEITRYQERHTFKEDDLETLLNDLLPLRQALMEGDHRALYVTKMANTREKDRHQYTRYLAPRYTGKPEVRQALMKLILFFGIDLEAIVREAGGE